MTGIAYAAANLGGPLNALHHAMHHAQQSGGVVVNRASQAGAEVFEVRPISPRLRHMLDLIAEGRRAVGVT